MTITDRLLDKIHALTAIDKTNGTYRIEEEFNRVRVFVELEAFDRLGLLVRRIEARKLAPPVEASAVEGVLRKQAQSVIERITYLNEDFRVVEVDATSACVQLRSELPQKRGNQLYFFNMILREGNALLLERLRRGSKGENSTEVVSTNLAKDAFVRLIQDLVELF